MFEPRINQTFYYISSELFVLEEIWEDENEFQVDLYVAGNCFETYEKADTVKQEVKAVLARYNKDNEIR